MTRKDKLSVIIVLILSSVLLLYCLYGLTISLSIWFFKDETIARVKEWKESSGEIYVVYTYGNKIDGHDYTIEKKISRRLSEGLRGKSELRIKYSTVFPTYTTVDEIPEYSYIFILIGVFLGLVAVYRSVQTLRRKIPLSDFT